jgi:hypothetical protein
MTRQRRGSAADAWSRQPSGALGHGLCTSGRTVLNNLGDEGRERVQAAYGENYSRLVAVKRTYDPDNFFRREPEHRSRNATLCRDSVIALDLA